MGLEASPSSPTVTIEDLSSQEDGPRNVILVGHYLRILGWAALLSVGLNLLAGGHLTLNFSFLIFLWLGGGLIAGKERFRKGVAIVCGIFAGIATVQLFLTLGITGYSEKMLSETRELAALKLGLGIIATGIPFLLLIAPSARHACRKEGFAEQASPPSSLRTIYYGLGIITLASHSLIVEHFSDRTELNAVGTLAIGKLKRGLSCEGIIRTQKSRTPLSVEWWVLADHDSYATHYDGPQISKLQFGSIEISIPVRKSVRFILQPRYEAEQKGNVYLVQSDGKVILLQRRVNLSNIAQAKAALRGVHSFDEIKQRLEEALPAVPSNNLK